MFYNYLKIIIFFIYFFLNVICLLGIYFFKCYLFKYNHLIIIKRKVGKINFNIFLLIYKIVLVFNIKYFLTLNL
jgi:hypothetical protein